MKCLAADNPKGAQADIVRLLEQIEEKLTKPLEKLRVEITTER